MHPAGGGAPWLCSYLDRRSQEDLNRVFSLPEIKELSLDLFQDFRRRLTPVGDPNGTDMGSTVTGVQETSGTLGGLGAGSGVPTEGDDPGSSITKDGRGTEKV